MLVGTGVWGEPRELVLVPFEVVRVQLHLPYCVCAQE